jgi:hypothetical protein
MPHFSSSLLKLGRRRGRLAAVFNRYCNRLGLLIIPLFLVPAISGCVRSKKENSSESATQTPKIEFEEKSHDFGTATEGDRLTHVFVVKNTGGGTLIIDRVSTSCGCTAAVLKKKEIPPGSQGEVEVTFDTTRRGGDNRKTITVQSNDPANPRMELEIRAKVETLLAFEPAFVRLNPEFGKQQVSEAWLTGKLKDTAKLKIVQGGDNPDVKVELIDKVEDGGAPLQGLRFTVNGKKVGFGNGTVMLETGIPKPDKVQVGFHWTVAGNIQVVPSQLYFSARSTGSNERVIRVSSRKPDFKLRDAHVASGPFVAKIMVPDAGVGYEVHVTLKKELDPAAAAASAVTEIGKLELLSNDSLEPKKEIPLRLAPQFNPAPMRSGPGGRPPHPMPPGPEGVHPPHPVMPVVPPTPPQH